MIITGLDIILIIVMLISAVLAMVRGFVREVLSIASWAVAAIATVYFLPRYIELAKEKIQPDILAYAVLGGGIFFGVLIVVAFITMRISDFILDSRIGALDRTLGFVFGLGRGLILVVIAFLFFEWLVPENQPGWIRDARSMPIIKQTGDAIMRLMPEDPEKVLQERLRNLKPGDETPEETPSTEDNGTTGSIDDKNRGYAAADRRNLDQLVEGAQSATQ